jgi:hypothetical protein
MPGVRGALELISSNANRGIRIYTCQSNRPISLYNKLLC